MEINVEINKKDVLNGKFQKTLSTIEGYLKEAEGDMQTSVSYRAKAVYTRITDIKEALKEDLSSLEKQININNGTH